MLHQAPAAELAEECGELALPRGQQAGDAQAMGDEMFGDGFDVLVDLGGEDFAHALQDVLDSAGPNVKALV